MRTTLSERQQHILEFIREARQRTGVPPTVREIGVHFGIVSTNGVAKHLSVLERGGHITKLPGRSRGISVPSSAGAAAQVPLLGQVAAGVPVLSPENREGDLLVDPSLFSIRAADRLFALAVRGDSMIEAHILDGDTVLVREQAVARNGDIVVALVDGEATVKRFYDDGGRIRLQPANRDMRTLIYEQGDVRVLGLVVGVMRKM